MVDFPASHVWLPEGLYEFFSWLWSTCLLVGNITISIHNPINTTYITTNDMVISINIPLNPIKHPIKSHQIPCPNNQQWCFSITNTWLILDGCKHQKTYHVWGLPSAAQSRRPSRSRRQRKATSVGMLRRGDLTSRGFSSDPHGGWNLSECAQFKMEIYIYSYIFIVIHMIYIYIYIMSSSMFIPNHLSLF